MAVWICTKVVWTPVGVLEVGGACPELTLSFGLLLEVLGLHSVLMLTLLTWRFWELT